jgi:hypothetical protein
MEVGAIDVANSRKGVGQLVYFQGPHSLATSGIGRLK